MDLANHVKFQFILTYANGKKETGLSLLIDGKEVESSHNIKVLGITIDQYLKFNKHISDKWSGPVGSWMCFKD